jgi:hypothetical protein
MQILGTSSILVVKVIFSSVVLYFNQDLSKYHSNDQFNFFLLLCPISKGTIEHRNEKTTTKKKTQNGQTADQDT